jgi:hypothetical protein
MGQYTEACAQKFIFKNRGANLNRDKGTKYYRPADWMAFFSGPIFLCSGRWGLTKQPDRGIIFHFGSSPRLEVGDRQFAILGVSICQRKDILHLIRIGQRSVERRETIPMDSDISFFFYSIALNIISAESLTLDIRSRSSRSSADKVNSEIEVRNLQM